MCDVATVDKHMRCKSSYPFSFSFNKYTSRAEDMGKEKHGSFGVVWTLGCFSIIWSHRQVISTNLEPLDVWIASPPINLSYNTHTHTRNQKESVRSRNLDLCYEPFRRFLYDIDMYTLCGDKGYWFASIKSIKWKSSWSGASLLPIRSLTCRRGMIVPPNKWLSMFPRGNISPAFV